MYCTHTPYPPSQSPSFSTYLPVREDGEIVRRSRVGVVRGGSPPHSRLLPLHPASVSPVPPHPLPLSVCRSTPPLEERRERESESERGVRASESSSVERSVREVHSEGVSVVVVLLTHTHISTTRGPDLSLCEISSFCPATTLSGKLPRKTRLSVHSALGRDLSLKLTFTST